MKQRKKPATPKRPRDEAAPAGELSYDDAAVRVRAAASQLADLAETLGPIWWQLSQAQSGAPTHDRTRLAAAVAEAMQAVEAQANGLLSLVEDAPQPQDQVAMPAAD